jgi:hypothetical protein
LRPPKILLSHHSLLGFLLEISDTFSSHFILFCSFLERRFHCVTRLVSDSCTEASSCLNPGVAETTDLCQHTQLLSSFYN